MPPTPGLVLFTTIRAEDRLTAAGDRTVGTQDHVVAGAAVERVVARAATNNHIIAGAAGNRVVPAAVGIGTDDRRDRTGNCESRRTVGSEEHLVTGAGRCLDGIVAEAAEHDIGARPGGDGISAAGRCGRGDCRGLAVRETHGSPVAKDHVDSPSCRKRIRAAPPMIRSLPVPPVIVSFPPFTGEAEERLAIRPLALKEAVASLPTKTSFIPLPVME